MQVSETNWNELKILKKRFIVRTEDSQRTHWQVCSLTQGAHLLKSHPEPRQCFFISHLFFSPHINFIFLWPWRIVSYTIRSTWQDMANDSSQSYIQVIQVQLLRIISHSSLQVPILQKGLKIAQLESGGLPGSTKLWPWRWDHLGYWACISGLLASIPIAGNYRIKHLRALLSISLGSLFIGV